MRTPKAGTVLIVLALLAALWQSAAQGQEPVELSRQLAETISAARGDLEQGRSGDAVERLLAYTGEDHALRHLVLGHAYARLSQWPHAADAYAQAMEMAPDLADAGLALAQVRVRQEKWTAAATLLGGFCEVDSCDADMLLLYAQVARRLEDDRLCRLLVDKGLIRFPADVRFRRLDLAMLLEADAGTAAARAATELLKNSPTDAGLWRQLAIAEGQAGSAAGRLASLEACVLCEAGDLELHRQFLAALVSAGDWMTAVARGEALLAGPLAVSVGADSGIMELLIVAADMGGRDELLAVWLDIAAEENRTRAMRIVEARLALREGRVADAREALEALIEAGATDPAAYNWAGHIAEQTEDWAAAETFYRQATRLSGRSAGLARLYLARLLVDRGRSKEAAALIRTHLRTVPEDSIARGMLDVIERADGAGKAQ